MEKFTFKPFDSTQEPEVFTTDNGYVESSGESDNRKQLSFPLKEIADFINNFLTVEIDNNKRYFDTLNEALSQEVSRATAKENSLKADIGHVSSECLSRDNLLFSQLQNETTRATTAENQINTSLNNKISEEASRAQSAESSLDTKISDNNQARIADIASLNANLSNEVSRAKNAEESLQTSISLEESRAKSAESNLKSELEQENSRASTAENALQNAILSEKNRAITAEGNLALEDTALKNRIDNLSATKQDVINLDNPLDYNYLINTPSLPQQTDFDMIFYLLRDNILFNCSDSSEIIYFADDNGNLILCN